MSILSHRLCVCVAEATIATRMMNILQACKICLLSHNTQLIICSSVRKRKRDSSSTASSVTIVCIDSEDEQNSTAKEGVRNTEEHDEELEDEDDDEPGASSRSTIFLSFVASAILTETAIDPPILISFSISVYSKKEFKKSNKNRRATASGILKLDNSLSEYKFCRAVYKKVGKLASVVASEDNTRILFTIARSVPNPIELGDDSNTFDHMMETASGMTKPAVTLAVVLDDGVWMFVYFLCFCF